MKKLLPLLVLCLTLFGASKMKAQPSIFFGPEYQLVNEGEIATLDILTNDFTNIQEVRFSVRWDPEVMVLDLGNEFVNFNPALGLDGSEFTFDNIEGFFTFEWKVEDTPGCPNTDITLSDGAVLFSINYEAINGYTEAYITNDPMDIYITRDNACPADIGCFCDVNTGFVAVDNQPITMTVPFVNANEGETFCMDLAVENFEDIVSFQFTIEWDPSILQFESVQGLNLPGWGPGNFNAQPANGTIATSWFDPPPTDGAAVADGTPIIQICFTVVGGCGQITPVEITSSVTPIEITNVDDPGQDIGFLAGEGLVSVNCFDPNGLTLSLPDIDICPGDDFCMDVTVENFVDLVQTDFSINWNPSVIQFTGIQNQTTDLFGFGAGSINTTQANFGLLGVEWNDPSCFGDNLNDGDVLFTMCFSSVGGGGVNTTVSFTSNPTEIAIANECFTDPNVGLNSFNGLVDVCSPPGITVEADSYTIDPGTSICVPVMVQDFDGVLEMAYSIEWETSVLEFTGIQGLNLDGLTLADFDLSFTNFGAICLDWTDPDGIGEVLADGTTIFELCFEAVGGPFACSEINFTEFPCGVNVVTEESNGFNVGINAVSGEVCMTNPFSFAVSVTDTASVPGDIVCVDFSVDNFVSLETMQFSVNWDQDIVQFVELQNPFSLPGFNTGSFDDSNAPFGIMTVDWASQQGNGTSLPGETVIFSLCYQLIGESGECSPISITNTPDPINVVPANSGGIDIGLINNDGEICISPVLEFLPAIIGGVDCPGDNTGSIDINIQGGSGSYNYMWSGGNIVPPNDTNEDQSGLTNGTYFLTVTDASFGNLVLDTFLVVGTSPLAPVAIVPTDTVFPCGEIQMVVCGDGSSTGAQYTYSWFPAVNGQGLVVPGTENTLCAGVIGAGNYVLEVTDNSLGCSVYDTVTIFSATAPAVVIEASGSIDCETDTVTLSGLGSSFGGNITYSWTTSDGNILPPTQDSLDALVDAPGTYFLTVTNTSSGCESVDSVMVAIDTISPIANAGMDLDLDCGMNMGMLDGSGSSAGVEFLYEWLDPMGFFLSDLNSPNVSEAGTYTLIVTDTTNGCFAMDMVMVTTATDLPISDPGEDTTLTCANPQIVLDGANSSTGADFTYAWTGPGIVGASDQITVEVNVNGVYSLEVTDIVGGCSSVATVTVGIDTISPIATAGVDTFMNCLTPVITLNGTGSSTMGVTYLWEGPGTILNETTLNPDIDTPGTYTLTVTSSENGCDASDEVEVVNDAELPVIDIQAPNGLTLNCEFESIVLDATGSSQGSQYAYAWGGPFCINSVDPLNPEIFCAGDFTLTIFDASNGCSKDTTITISENNNVPVALASAEDFTCLTTAVNVDVTGTSMGTQYTYTWVTIPNGNGNILSAPTELNLIAGGPGTYGLTIVDTISGCDASTTVNVIADTIPPMVSAGADMTLTCNTTTVTLDGSGSTSTDVTFDWSFGGNSVSAMQNPMVSDAGTYTLTVTSTENGCSASDEVEVILDETPPMTDAGGTFEIGCTDDFVQIGGASATGPDITYQWVALSGTINGAVDQITAQATEPGQYELTVTDNITGCVGTDIAEVISVVGLPAAEASVLGDDCAEDIMVMGNLPEGTTGMWSVNTSATFVDPAAAETFVEGLIPGPNQVTWTLSGADCPDYSSATIDVFVESAPIANNDVAEIVGNEISATINVVTNDVTLGVTEYTVEIVTPPGVGDLSGENGMYTYTPSLLFFEGDVEFEYAICNANCPDLCDTAVVKIMVDKEGDVGDLPNGITPNGDNVNDALVFDILLANPEKFPDNEIVIFNRWGNIVYQASPYQNDWVGTNGNNEELPSGTYYYILRLNVADGEILRGDVTIVK